MSLGHPMPYGKALRLARDASEWLRPVVQRLEIAGSLRRRREQVRDIEFVAEPHFNGDLFGGESPLVKPIRAVLHEMGTWVKGGERMMQVTDLFGHEGVKLELYLVHPPAQWGSILAIRTGPYQLGEHCMSAMWPRGYQHRRGHAVRIDTAELVPTPEEADFFRLAGVPCLPPPLREAQARQLKQ